MRKVLLLSILIPIQSVLGQKIEYETYDIARLSNAVKGYSYVSTHRPEGQPGMNIISVLDSMDVIGYANGELIHTKKLFQKDLESVGVKAADMNKDGIMDLVLGSYWSNRISIYMGTHESGFSQPTHYYLDGHCNGFQTGDINKDGYPDVVAVRNGSGKTIAIHVFINKGDGTLEKTFFHDAGDHTNNEVYITDLDNDGKNDILIRSTNGFVVSYLQNTPNAFDFHYIPIMPFLPGTPFTIPGGTGINNEDFDSDGTDDLLVTYQDSLIIRKGNGDGTFEEKAFFKFTGTSLTNILSARLNKNNIDIIGTKIDNLERSNPDSLLIFNYDPVMNSLNLTHGIELPLKLGFGREQVRIADLTGDQVPDISILAEKNDLLILKGATDDPITSIPENPKVEISIYPNPTSGIINIDTRPFIGKSLKIKLLDGSGRVIIENEYGKMTSESLQLNIGMQDKLVLLQWIANGRSSTRKILVN